MQDSCITTSPNKSNRSINTSSFHTQSHFVDLLSKCTKSHGAWLVRRQPLYPYHSETKFISAWCLLSRCNQVPCRPSYYTLPDISTRRESPFVTLWHPHDSHARLSYRARVAGRGVELRRYVFNGYLSRGPHRVWFPSISESSIKPSYYPRQNHSLHVFYWHAFRNANAVDQGSERLFRTV